MSSTVNIRGRVIAVNAKSETQRLGYVQLYSGYDNERLDSMAAETERDVADRDIKRLMGL